MGLLLLINLGGDGSLDGKSLLAGLRLIACVNAVLVTTYLWSAAYGSPTGEQSVKELTEGATAPLLWLGVFVCGIILPLAVSLADYFLGRTPPAWLVAASGGAIAGVFAFNYCILKGGLYGSLIPRSGKPYIREGVR